MKSFIIILVFIFSIFSCSSKGEVDSSASMVKGKPVVGGTTVLIKTSKGDITIELAIKEAPITAKNFISLVRDKFYDGLIFHRVVKGFVIQGGDPTGTGTGGAKSNIKLEILCKSGKVILGSIAPGSCDPVLTHKKGAIAMARANDPNSASSQFYITLDLASYLDRSYSVFGYVTKGQPVVDSIEKGDKIDSIRLLK